jgi:hypothetical protein
MQSSDDALAAIEQMLPAHWVLDSIQVTADLQYSVLLRPLGPIAKSELGPGGRVPTVVATRPTVREALIAAADQLEQLTG